LCTGDGGHSGEEKEKKEPQSDVHPVPRGRRKVRRDPQLSNWGGSGKCVTGGWGFGCLGGGGRREKGAGVKGGGNVGNNFR